MNRLTGWLAALRERVTGLLFEEREAAELEEELRFHLEMEAERLVREEGLEPGEARRRAAVSFGGVERTKEEVRAARGLGWVTGWWLDVKLGLRMLVKHPGLTVLGGLSMAFAIFMGAAAFELISQMVRPSLPLPEGDRVVALQLWNVEHSDPERRTLYDLPVWREELDAVRDVGAFRTLERNLVGSDGYAERVTVAAMDPAGFRVAGVAPILGRTLLDADQRGDAPPVVVIGHEVWVDRFAGDPDVVGRDALLGGEPAMVVGVMPEGFGFPFAHDAWIPFAAHEQAYAPLEGPRIMVFGRLAPGADLADARAEMEVVGSRMAAAFPATHEHLRPQVAPWARVWLGSVIGGADPSVLTSVALAAMGVASNLPLLLFLILVCGNVALLTFARASAREGELVIRSALGASRRRIILQLFFEALVLASLAALVGLAVARYSVGWMFRITETVLLEGGRLPFWFDAGLSPATLFYVGLLTVLAAAVAGVVPGLRVTRDLRSQLHRDSAGGGGFRFGGIWTAVIVTQIAVTLVFPSFTLILRAEADRELAEDLDLPSEEYLSAQLELQPPAGLELPPDSAGAWVRSQFRPTLERLADRLRSEPRIRGVTFTERLPREYHGWRQVEVDGPTAEPGDDRGHRIAAARVAVDYFDVLGAEITAGRGFRLSDLGEGQRAVVVNESFVERVMGGRNPVGQRIRYRGAEEFRYDPESAPWHLIVGVVEDLGTISGYGAMGMYHPADPADIHPISAVLHVSGDPRSFEPTLRGIAMEVDPALTLANVIRLDQVTRGQREFYAFWSAILGGVSGLALLLSLGGIFAVMSFTISRRTREVGIRVALGASRRRVITAVFRKPLIQIGLGLLTGSVLLWIFFFGPQTFSPDPKEVLFLLLYVAGMTAVCLLACIAPTRRALSVEPAEALRVEG